MTSLTRGSLPAWVYWRRRVLLVAVALVLVFGLARVLGASSDGSSSPDRATSVAADATTSVPTTTASPSAGPTATREPKKPRPVKTSEVPVLAAPDGQCSASDVAVTPEVERAVGGPEGQVLIALQLRTLVADACDWKVSPTSLTLKITSGDEEIWTSRECPRAIGSREVVLRNNATTTVDFSWTGKRSDEECSDRTEWALPGWYHVAVSAFAGEPSDVQFKLERRSDPPEPKDKNKEKDGKNKEKDKKDDRSDEQSQGEAQDGPSPSASASGAVEPD